MLWQEEKLREAWWNHYADLLATGVKVMRQAEEAGMDDIVEMMYQLCIQRLINMRRFE